MTNVLPVPVCAFTEVALPTEVIGPVKLAFAASFPLSFCIAERMESVAETVPAPDVYPVSTLAITGAFVSVVALPTDVTSPVRSAFVITVDAHVPAVIVPTDVRDEPVTPLAKVAPDKVPAGAMTTAVEIEVVKPLALMVTTGIAVEDPVVPAVATVARVATLDPVPAGAVTSPVSAVIPGEALLRFK
jgi:hypothetical protein